MATQTMVPSKVQRRLLACMRDGNTRIRMFVSRQFAYRASLDDAALPSFASSIPMATFDAMFMRKWIELESERSTPAGNYKYFRITEAGRAALESN